MQASTNTDFFASIETNSLHSQESTVAEAVGMFPPFFDHSADEAAGGGMMITEHQAANNDTDVAEIEVPLLPPRTVSRTNSVASSLENTTLDGTFEINAPNISILQRLKERLNHINTHQSDSSFGCFPGEGDDNRNGTWRREYNSCTFRLQCTLIASKNFCQSLLQESKMHDVGGRQSLTMLQQHYICL